MRILCTAKDSHIFSTKNNSVLARLHEVHRAIVVTSVVHVYVYVRVTLSVKDLKFFRSLYLLTMLMDQVDTLHVDRYWSEVLRSTIIEVKVTDLEILCLSFWLKFL